MLAANAQLDVRPDLAPAFGRHAHQLADALDSLATADAGKWSFVTVNVDVVPRVAQMFGIEAVPTVVALAGGQPLASFQGVQPPEQLRQWIDSLLSATAGKLGGEPDAEEEQVDPALAQSLIVENADRAKEIAANEANLKQLGEHLRALHKAAGGLELP